MKVFYMHLVCVEDSTTVSGVDKNIAVLFDEVMSGAPRDIVSAAEQSLQSLSDHITVNRASTEDGKYYSVFAIETDMTEDL